jgi:hypothetical protein
MLKKSLHIIISISTIFISADISGQACCTSGTPLLGSLDMSTSSKGLMQFSFTYDYNTLTDVYTGSSELDDDTRSRLTQAGLLEINYGLSRRITLTALFSYVNQSRSINGFGDRTNELSVSGAGDALAMVKYSLIPMNIIDEVELAAGAGIKAPVGKSEIKSNGILLPADMQPGTGSWDILLWAFYTKGRLFDLPMNFISNISYRLNGENDRYGPNQEGYQFGNELALTAGLGYRTDMLLDFSLMFRYRHTAPDIFAESELPNTGGEWLYMVPGINIKIYDNFTGRLAGQIPIYRNLNGTQLTTTFTTSFTLFYSLNFLTI